MILFSVLLVQSALALVRGFPPPTARAGVVTGLHGTCAGLAADAGETLVEEFVVGHVVLMDVVADLLLAPVDERVHLDESVDVVLFY